MRTAFVLAALSALAAVPARADAPKLAAHVAPMVERGRTWVFDIALTVWGGTDTPKRVTTRDKVTCKVASVTIRKRVPVSHVTCDKDMGWKFKIAGYYAATPAGLWRVGLEDAPTDEDLATVMKGPPLIATEPKPFERVEKIDGPDPKHDTIIEGLRTSPKTGGWCSYSDSSDADPDGGRVVVCYAPGIGIESGYDDVGGELNRFEYTARR